MTKVRIGIIGMGNIGQHHAGYLGAGKISRAELVAVSDAIPGKLDKYKPLKIFSDGEELINSGLVEYLGTTKDVRPFIKQADCVVLPSYREGTPRTLLEAASIAKPIITTDVPGCHHVVSHNYNGLLCKMKDADDLARKMKTLMGFSDEALKSMGPKLTPDTR